MDMNNIKPSVKPLYYKHDKIWNIFMASKADYMEYVIFPHL